MSTLTTEFPLHPARLPLPAGPRPDGRPSLTQCVTLALLIHILVVLVFGSAPGGSARPGEGVWGTLNIRLTGSDAGGRSEATVAADEHSGPAGTATRQRFGGAVRAPDPAQALPPTPGAARQGLWQARPAESATGRDAPPPVPPAPPAPPDPPDPPDPEQAVAPSPSMRVTTPAPATLPAPTVRPPALSAAPAAGPAAEPAVRAPPSVALPSQPAPAAPAETTPPGAPALRATPDENLPIPALDTPAPVPAAVDAPAPPSEAAPAARVVPLEAPPTPIPLPSAPALRALPLALPLPVLPAPVAAPVPPAPLAALPPPAPAPPPIETPVSPPLSPPRAPALAAPVVSPPTASTARDATAPPPAADVQPEPETLAAPDRRSPGLPPVLPAPDPARASAAGAVPGPPEGSRAAAAAGAVQPAGARDLTAPAAGGAPDAGARVGHDVATAPSLPPSAPRLQLDLVRPRGGPISAQGSRGLLATMPLPPDTRNKLAEDLKKAGKADCRKAYAGMGVLAVVPLAADALNNQGCRW